MNNFRGQKKVMSICQNISKRRCSVSCNIWLYCDIKKVIYQYVQIMYCLISNMYAVAYCDKFGQFTISNLLSELTCDVKISFYKLLFNLLREITNATNSCQKVWLSKVESFLNDEYMVLYN